MSAVCLYLQLGGCTARSRPHSAATCLGQSHSTHSKLEEEAAVPVRRLL